MVFTRLGSEVEIIRNCGEHKLPQFQAPVTLLLIRFSKDDISPSYRFLHTLKADEGLTEIAQAAKEAAPVGLDEHELVDAIKEAM